MKTLSKIPETLALAQQVKANAAAINKLIEYVNSLRPISAINERVSHGPDGVLREVLGTGKQTGTSAEQRWL